MYWPAGKSLKESLSETKLATQTNKWLLGPLFLLDSEISFNWLGLILMVITALATDVTHYIDNKRKRHLKERKKKTLEMFCVVSIHFLLSENMSVPLL